MKCLVVPSLLSFILLILMWLTVVSKCFFFSFCLRFKVCPTTDSSSHFFFLCFSKIVFNRHKFFIFFCFAFSGRHLIHKNIYNRGSLLRTLISANIGNSISMNLQSDSVVQNDFTLSAFQHSFSIFFCLQLLFLWIDTCTSQ